MGHKIKCLLQILPTTDILHRNYPRIIPADLYCQRCNITSESNTHLWLCPESQLFLTNAQSTLSRSIVMLIAQFKGDATVISEITRYVRNLPLFSAPDPSAPEFLSHPFILFCNNFIPMQLIHIFKTFHIPTKLYSQPLMDILSVVHSYLYVNIWKARSLIFKIWKEEHNITKDSFKLAPTSSRLTSESRSCSRRNSNRNGRSSISTNVSCRSPIADPTSRLSLNADWIRWTSSNFLHSVPWHNAYHLDYTYNSVLVN